MMPKQTDAEPVSARLYFLPVQTRVPLKFGTEITTSVTCARACITVRGNDGTMAEGWGETPLSVQWVWPSSLPYETRHGAMKEFCRILGGAWSRFDERGHALEVGHRFVHERLPGLLKEFNGQYPGRDAMPWLAALVCCSAFDIALHDAWGMLNKMPVYATYTSEFMSQDLASFLCASNGNSAVFKDKFPRDFMVLPRAEKLPAWHLVGGKDPISASELTGSEPMDGYPILLADWIERDGLFCLKVKLRGNDTTADYERLVAVGKIAVDGGVLWLSADFNCTVTEPAYVNEILDRLLRDEPRIYGMLLYVEQPFPYDLESHEIDVHSVSARKPLFMDESAHDWQMIRLGRTLGWTGVALKTCKTQTGALLSLCWAKAHGMTLMVQDLTNPMLAQIPHLSLAAHAGTIMGVETNSMQFYPEASAPEARAHPGLFKRRDGYVTVCSITGPGFGYRLEEIHRELPPAEGEGTVTEA